MVSMVTSSPLAMVRTGFKLASKKPQWQVSGLECRWWCVMTVVFLAGLVGAPGIMRGNPHLSNKAAERQLDRRGGPAYDSEYQLARNVHCERDRGLFFVLFKTLGL